MRLADESNHAAGGLAGRRILVTGGAGGIGAAISRRLAAGGAEVIVADRDGDGARTIAEEVGGRALVVDFSRHAEAIEVVRDACEELHGLVNGAAVTASTSFPRIEADDWERVIDLDLTAPFLLTQALLDRIDTSVGAVVNITSIAARTVLASTGEISPAYSAAKAGLTAVSNALAVDLGKRGIRVNAVAPGYIETPMTTRERSESYAWLEGKVPVGRWGTPEDVAGPVAFLLSDEAAYISGATLVVDGGLTVGLVRTAGAN